MRILIRKINLSITLLLMVGLAVFLIKCVIVYPIKYVGHADASGYAEMADSLVHGRGFEVDYISWYFLKYDPDIVRPEDHWPPLYSMFIAPFFLVLGKTAFAAKLPSLIISCFLLPMVLYSLARELTGSKMTGLAAGLVVMLSPIMFKSSLHCLSDVTSAFVVSAGVLFAVKALSFPAFSSSPSLPRSLASSLSRFLAFSFSPFLPLGVFMGLAYYAKGSGLVPIPGYILFFVIARRSVKKVITDRRFLLSLLIAFLVLLPWMIRNYIHFRDPLFSTQRFSAGYVGYEDWEEGTYELYWGEKPPPSYFDKFKEEFLFQVKPDFQGELDNEEISKELRQEFKKNKISLTKNVKVSVKKAGSKWLVRDKLVYTVKKEGDKIEVYQGGIPHVVEMTKDYLRRYFWWTFMDIDSNWGKFGKSAFLTYFVNFPAILVILILLIGHSARVTRSYLKHIWWVFVDKRSIGGKASYSVFLRLMQSLAALGAVLLWGNKKRHAVWITTILLILFLSIGWSPIFRLALPMTCLMMALGLAVYFSALKMIFSLLSRIPFSRMRRLLDIPLGSGNLDRKKREFTQAMKRIARPVKRRLSVDIVAGFMVCMVASPVIILSAEKVNIAAKKEGYPYREGSQEWMDMGRWLKENAPPDSITMTRNPWELHFYSDQLAIQIPKTTLEKTIEVIRYYKPAYIIPQLDIRPSLKPLVQGKVPGLELVYDNKKLQLYKIHYDLLPE